MSCARTASLLTGWKKWVLGAIATLAGAIAWFTQEQPEGEPMPGEQLEMHAPAPLPCAAANTETGSAACQ